MTGAEEAKVYTTYAELEMDIRKLQTQANALWCQANGLQDTTKRKELDRQYCHTRAQIRRLIDLTDDLLIAEDAANQNLPCRHPKVWDHEGLEALRLWAREANEYADRAAAVHERIAKIAATEGRTKTGVSKQTRWAMYCAETLLQYHKQEHANRLAVLSYALQENEK